MTSAFQTAVDRLPDANDPTLAPAVRPPRLGTAKPGHHLPPFRLNQHLFFWLTQVVSRRDRQLIQALKPVHLRVFEWRVMAALRGSGPLSMGKAADLSGVDRTTLSRIVAGMTRRGLIERSLDEQDMRIARLTLTPSGTELFTRIWPDVASLNDVALADLPAPVIHLMRWALGKMRENLDASLAEPARRRRPA